MVEPLVEIPMPGGLNLVRQVWRTIVRGNDEPRHFHDDPWFQRKRPQQPLRQSRRYAGASLTVATRRRPKHLPVPESRHCQVWTSFFFAGTRAMLDGHAEIPKAPCQEMRCDVMGSQPLL